MSTLEQASAEGGVPTDAELEALARAHGTGGWQTLPDMVRFARAVLAIKPQPKGTAAPSFAEWCSKNWEGAPSANAHDAYEKAMQKLTQRQEATQAPAVKADASTATEQLLDTLFDVLEGHTMPGDVRKQLEAAYWQARAVIPKPPVQGSQP